MCKPCRRAYEAARHKANPQEGRDKFKRHKKKKNQATREYLWKLLNESPCVDCGLIDPVVMEFDHRPDEQKLYNIGAMVGNTYSQATLLAEIAKCDIVCANCHRHRTNSRSGWWRGQWQSDQQPIDEEENT